MLTAYGGNGGSARAKLIGTGYCGLGKLDVCNVNLEMVADTALLLLLLLLIAVASSGNGR